MSFDPACLLCAKLAQIDQRSQSEVVWEFEHSVALLGPWQYYPGYCVLISLTHASELSQLGANRAAYLHEMAVLAEAIENSFRPHKINYELLGNQVPHLHWHLFPRSIEDPDRFKPVWFALDRGEKDPNEKLRLETSSLSREETVRRLRESIERLLK